MSSSFQFPIEKEKYSEVKNIKILQAMLKFDARKQPKIRINPFKLIIYKKYGYVANIVAQCQSCSAKIKYKGTVLETDHYNDESGQGDSTNQANGREKIVDVTYKLVEFNNNHQHSKQSTSKEELARKRSLRYQNILDHYDALVKQGANQNIIKCQLAKKFSLTEQQSQKIISPYKKMQQLYKATKQKMNSMNFTIIQKMSDMIDVSKIKSTLSSYVDFPNQWTLITPNMLNNFIKYGHTIYFGLYPQYVAQSKKLIMVGGFYGINEHHKFVPFANIIVSIFKKEEEIVVFNNLNDVLQKEDEQIIKMLMSIFKTFFSYYNKKVDCSRNILLVIRQTSNTQAAIYQTRKEITNLNFIYCFREKLNNLQIEVNRRYCNDSSSSEQKLDFIISLYKLVKTLDEEQYNIQLKSLFKKANTNNTLLLQKIIQDSHLFCFCKIKDSCNNLYDQCIDDYLKKKFKPIIKSQQRSNHMYMKNIMNIINRIIKDEKLSDDRFKVQLKPSVCDVPCHQCRLFQEKPSYFNEAQIYQDMFPELKTLKYKICVKTYYTVMKQMVKCLSIKSHRVINQYNQKQYFIFKNGVKYKVVEQEGQKLSCDCQISDKYGIPCAHELFVCTNLKIPIEKQLSRWMLELR